MREYMIGRSLRGFGDLTFAASRTPASFTPPSAPLVSAPRTAVVATVKSSSTPTKTSSGSGIVRATVFSAPPSSDGGVSSMEPWRAQILAAAEAYQDAVEAALELMPSWGGGATAARVAGVFANAARTETVEQLRMRVSFWRPIARVDMPASRFGASAEAAAADVLAAQDQLRALVLGGASAGPAHTPTPTFTPPPTSPLATAAQETAATLEAGEDVRASTSTPAAPSSGGSVVYGSGGSTFPALGSWWERYRWWALSLGGGAVIALFLFLRRR